MSARRPLLLLAASCAALALAAPTAAQPNPADYPETVTTDRFRVHFTGEQTRPLERILYQDAADVAALAERAYQTLVTQWGHPAPLDDGDGLIDIWVMGLTDALGFASKEPAGNPTSGWIAIDAIGGRTMETIAHELFHLIQFGIWTPADDWLLEGSAEWVAYEVDGYTRTNLSATYAAPDLSLDCVGPACGNDDYEIGGYSRWTFFQYLSERFGRTFVRDVLAEGAAAGNAGATGAQLLSSSLAARGTTLGDVYTDYTATHMTAAYAQPALQGVFPAHYSSTSTPPQSGALPVRHVSVNRLAVRYLRFVPAATATGLCHAATLTLTVALPAGVAARPSFYSPGLGASALPLSVSGGTASISVPWSTCAGASPGYLSLPNPSTTLDARMFTVSGTVSVDTSTIAAPTGPPPGLWSGATEAAPAGEVAPSIHVYGAQVLRVAARTRTVRLIVFASGSGRLQATLGGKVVHTAALRGGNNDVRFKLPATTVSQLRRTSSLRSSAGLLSLRSLSTTGVAGSAVTRRVSIVQPSKKPVKR